MPPGDNAMEQTASTLQAVESSQLSSNQAAPTEDSSAKTIEFLRARLLAERASSKAARKEAQEISEKVKALNAQLEAEMESRKAAEAAMERVFTILKAKGLDIEDLVAEHHMEQAGSTTDQDTKETMNKSPQEYTEITSCIDKAEDSQASSGHSTAESTQASTEEINPFSQNSYGEVQQLALRDKPMVYTDKTSTTCVPYSEEDPHPSQANEKGLTITQKLKAMVQKIEEEMILLPTEQQPLKLELQGWINHIIRVLEKERDTAFQTHASDGIMEADSALILPSKLRHNRRSSCDSLEFLQEPFNKPMHHPQMMKNGISHSLRFPDSLTPNSPRSDGVSASSSSSEAGFRLHISQDRYTDHRHIRSDEGHAYPRRSYIHGVRNAGVELHAINTPHDPMSIPPHDAVAFLLMDYNKGRLGDTLMALDAARENVGEEEEAEKQQLFGASHTPIAEKTELKGGNPCGDDQTWRPSDYSQMIQFPPSPASEHKYSPFELRHSRHRRSSSVCIDDTMSGCWPRKGEVQLANGITLYTD